MLLRKCWGSFEYSMRTSHSASVATSIGDGLQRPQKRPKVFFHLRNKRGDVQSASLRGPDVRDDTEVLDLGLQVVCEERITGKG